MSVYNMCTTLALHGSIRIYVSMVTTVCLYAAVVQATKLKQEYFTDVAFSCNNSETFNTTTHPSNSSEKHIVNQIWILPCGQTVDETTQLDERISVTDRFPSLTIEIKRIDDPDFGTYVCANVWNDSSVTFVVFHLNADGASFEYLTGARQQRALIGVGVAAAVLLICIVSYVIWHFFCSEKVKRKRKISKELEKGVHRYSTQFYDNVGLEHYTKKGSF